MRQRRVERPAEACRHLSAALHRLEDLVEALEASLDHLAEVQAALVSLDLPVLWDLVGDPCTDPLREVPAGLEDLVSQLVSRDHLQHSLVVLLEEDLVANTVLQQAPRVEDLESHTTHHQVRWRKMMSFFADFYLGLATIES